MKKIIFYFGLTASCGVLLTLLMTVNCWADPGTLPLQNRFPLHFLFLTPRPISPQTPDDGELRTSMALEYTSVNFDRSNDRWDFLMDMEITTVDLSLAYGVTSRLALRLEMPLVTLQDGFLDDFLETYHDTLNVPNYGREDRPKNTFGYAIFKQGEPWVEGRTTGLTPADSTVSLAYALPAASSSHAFSGKLVCSLKLPVGDTDLGLGSGHYDFGIYWAAGWIFDKWSFYLMPGWAWINDPDTRGAEVTARNTISLFIGTAYQYNDKLQLIAQVNGYTSPVEETGINAMDDGSLELGLGFQYEISEKYRLDFAFGEDLSLAAPDFTVHLGLAWSLL